MKLFSALFLAASLFLVGCGGEKPAKQETKNADGLTEFEVTGGIGPIKEKVTLGAIDKELVAKGGKLFTEKCTACHSLDERKIGPAQRDVFKRRSPEYIMNMIQNPQGMLDKHPEAKKMLAEYKTPMTFMQTSKSDARALLEYFRQVVDEKPEAKK